MNAAVPSSASHRSCSASSVGDDQKQILADRPTCRPGRSGADALPEVEAVGRLVARRSRGVAIATRVRVSRPAERGRESARAAARPMSAADRR